MTNNLGMGAMLHMLVDHSEMAELLDASQGKQIKSLRIDSDYNAGDGGLAMRFADGSGIWIYDDARSCCETRYMHTDDYLASFVGATFRGARYGEHSETTKDYETIEIQFVWIDTSLGTFTLETRNEHNGYYGGIVILAKAMEEGE